jgi:hypothetical protein
VVGGTAGSREEPGRKPVAREKSNNNKPVIIESTGIVKKVLESIWKTYQENIL